MNTTSKLLGVSYRKSSIWVERLAVVSRLLLERYGLPRLGNFRDPVKEIFYILLSAKTTDAQYRLTHNRLWKAFPSLTLLANAKLSAIRSRILSGGLASKRARQIRATARRLITVAGKNPSKYLRSLEVEEAFDFIRSLPGMGPKSALCVIMYSLDADAFPVDVNVQRIAERLGVIPKGIKHYRAQQMLAALVPDGFCRELHIGMVVHGRTICLPRQPKCNKCPIKGFCCWGQKRGSANGNS